uniref:Si:ch211-113e8.9 n=1 Tax=Sinocyclocheilus anshuiensis TaxID=1608454 RepID=A0A671RMP7_9TELE
MNPFIAVTLQTLADGLGPSSLLAAIFLLFLFKDEPLQILLVGMTGAGRIFKLETSSSSVTKQCEKNNATVNGRNLLFIDTPGLFDTSLTKDEVIDRIKRCILLSLGRFTDEEAEAVRIIQNIFGEESSTYTIALFTHGDVITGRNIHKFVRNSPKLLSFIKTCSGRFHVFNNEEQNTEQVIQLFEQIDKIVTGNGGQHYTNEMLDREKVIEAEISHILTEKREQRQKETEALRATSEGKVFEKAKQKLDSEYKQQARWQAEKNVRMKNGGSSFLNDVIAFVQTKLKS